MSKKSSIMDDEEASHSGQSIGSLVVLQVNKDFINNRANKSTTQQEKAVAPELDPLDIFDPEKFFGQNNLGAENPLKVTILSGPTPSIPNRTAYTHSQDLGPLIVISSDELDTETAKNLKTVDNENIYTLFPFSEESPVKHKDFCWKICSNDNCDFNDYTDKVDCPKCKAELVPW